MAFSFKPSDLLDRAKDAATKLGQVAQEGASTLRQNVSATVEEFKTSEAGQQMMARVEAAKEKAVQAGGSAAEKAQEVWTSDSVSAMRAKVADAAVETKSMIAGRSVEQVRRDLPSLDEDTVKAVAELSRINSPLGAAQRAMESAAESPAGMKIKQTLDQTLEKPEVKQALDSAAQLSNKAIDGATEMAARFTSLFGSKPDEAKKPKPGM